MPQEYVIKQIRINFGAETAVSALMLLKCVINVYQPDLLLIGISNDEFLGELVNDKAIDVIICTGKYDVDFKHDQVECLAMNNNGISIAHQLLELFK